MSMPATSSPGTVPPGTVPPGPVPPGATPPGTAAPRPGGPGARGPLPLTAGRRAALAIGVPVCLLVVASTGLDLVATFGQGSFPVSYTAPAADRSLTVSTPGGQVLVNGVTGGPAEVTGQARYSLVRSTVTAGSRGGAATVGYQCAVPVGNCAFDPTVSAPASVRVTVSTDGGTAAVLGTAGPVTLSTGGGDIIASGTSGPLSLSTTGGSIRAGAVDSATVTASAGGGDVAIGFNRVPRSVRVETSGGNITIVLPAGPAVYRVVAHTDGGNVTDTVPQESAAPNVITATTGGGDIIIRQQ